MDEKKTSEQEKFDESEKSHEKDPEQREEYLQPWLRQLGSEYARNEELGKYEKLTDAVADLLKRPKAKEIPEKYDIREGADELFKKSGLTLEEAKEVDGFYSKFIPSKLPPDLKEYFKDGYSEKIKNYDKGVKSISDDLAKEIEEYNLDKNPVFVEIMARIGKETGESFFRKSDEGNARKNDPAMDAVRKAYESYYGK